MIAAAPAPKVPVQASQITSEFKDESDLIAWLDGLYSCNENGVIHNQKWEPAQRAIAALKATKNEGGPA